MKVCGFSFIRNALIYDYPIVEAIQSILPLCDQVFIAVGQSADETKKLVQSISDKVVVIDTIWSNNREGGRVLAEETDKAYRAIRGEYDWCIYIQGDEVIHECDYPIIKRGMIEHKGSENVDGLLFNYHHFYGSYDYIATSGKWYQNEVRIVRQHSDLFSYQDAMGFRKKPNKKLNVKAIDAYIYHYGWVKNPKDQQAKLKSFETLWHSDEKIAKVKALSKDSFDYSKIDKIALFEGLHPKVMDSRIENKNWKIDLDVNVDNRSIKEKIRAFINLKTGWRPGKYQNYKIV
jgi:hypothetical protein